MTFKSRLMNSILNIQSPPVDSDSDSNVVLLNPNEKLNGDLTYKHPAESESYELLSAVNSKPPQLSAETAFQEANKRIEADAKASVAAEARARAEASARLAAEMRIKAETSATEEARARSKAEALATKEAQARKELDARLRQTIEDGIKAEKEIVATLRAKVQAETLIAEKTRARAKEEALNKMSTIKKEIFM